MHKTDALVDVVLKTKEEKDAELDKRIEALRKKNEALMKRYQEIEEDKKRAELEGMAITTRKNKPETLTITITKAPNEKRVVSEKRGVGRPSSLKGFEVDDVGQRFSIGRGHRLRKFVVEESKAKEWEERRKHNIEKMNEEMEEIAEYERSRREGKVDKNPVRNFLDDRRRSGPLPEGDKHVASRRHVRNWGGPDFEMVKSGIEKKHWGKGSQEGGKHANKSTVDMTLSMTGRERAEYARWKKERDQIDQERLARHKNSKGEWKRAWDANKSEDMFREDFTVDSELGFHKKKGGRNTRKYNARFQQSEARDDWNRSDRARELSPRIEATDSTKSRGKDRLTGRARCYNRFDAKGKFEIQTETGDQWKNTEHKDQMVNEEEKLWRDGSVDIVVLDWEDIEEDTDVWRNGVWDMLQPCDSQTSSLDLKDSVLLDVEGTVNKQANCDSKLGDISLAAELLDHNASDENGSHSQLEIGVLDHGLLSGSDIQDNEETGNNMSNSSVDTETLEKTYLLDTLDKKSVQSVETEDHETLKDKSGMEHELPDYCDTQVDSLTLNEIADGHEEAKIICSSATENGTRSLASNSKLQDVSGEEATSKLQLKLKPDNVEISQQIEQESSVLNFNGGNNDPGPDTEKKCQQTLSEEKERNGTDHPDAKGTPGNSTVVLKKKQEISPDSMIIDINNCNVVGIMVEEN
uniref:Coiled-coil domain-containing protein 9-like n=1 Tax=Callorhinchus milii TaxID=7868 RepID=A0A4W3K076_CALMI|eukprot:gi/632951619/ref/XP_007891400.1/ PREDICTED: coiled-coil domain-containing protein 9-like isoform X1 [Callorhinchus milii]